MKLINISCGSPFQFYITCPKNAGHEHPLVGVSRMLSLTEKVKKDNPEMVVVSSAYSYLRQFSPQAAAGSIVEGFSDMAGYGRMSFAYPDVAKDIVNNQFNEKQTCISCADCGYPCRVRGNR